MIVVILVIIGILLIISTKQINEYERGILFRLGKFAKILNPGWHLVFPIIHSYKKVDIRTKTV
ncbi:MAG: SPFH domain-containing protein, partial [Clostridia bacterium]